MYDSFWLYHFLPAAPPTTSKCHTHYSCFSPPQLTLHPSFLTLHIVPLAFYWNIHKLTWSVFHLTLVLCQSFLLAVPLSCSLESCLGFHFAPLFSASPALSKSMRGVGWWGGQRFLLLLDSFKAAASFRRGPPDVHFGTDLFLIFHISFSIYFFSKWWNQGAAVLIVALLRSQPPCCVWGDLLSDRRVELLAVYCPRDESLMSGSFCTSTPNCSFVDVCLYYILLYVTNYLKGVLQTRPEQWK